MLQSLFKYLSRRFGETQTNETSNQGTITQAAELEEAKRANDIAEEANRIATRANANNRWIIVLTMLAVALNLWLVYISREGINASIISAKAADSTVKIAKQTLDSTIKYNNRTALSQASAEIKIDKQTAIKSTRDSTALALQMNTFKETKKQFEVGNEPYLQISDPKVRPLEIGKGVHVSVVFQNLGNYPVKVIKYIRGAGISIKPYGFEELKTIPDYHEYNNIYLIKGSTPQQWEMDGALVTNQKMIDFFNSGECFVFFVGYCQFENLITKSIKTYKFAVKINNRNGYLFIVNENINGRYGYK